MTTMNAKKQLSRYGKVLILIALTVFAQSAMAVNRYWVANGAGPFDWNNTAHWSASSGGASGASVPGVNDLAIFDGAGGANGPCSINTNVSVSGIQINGYNGTITQNAFTITMAADGYSQNSGTFSGSASAITINSTGTFTLTGGSFTSTSGTLTISGTRGANQTIFTHSAGTFAHNNGTVALNPGSGCTQYTFTVDVLNTTSFYNVSLQATTGCSPVIITTAGSDVIYVSNNFTHSDGIFNGLTEVQGNLQVNAGADGGTGTITINGTGSQNFGQSGTGRTGQIVVNKSAGAFTPASGTTTFYMQSFSLQNGGFTAPSGNMNIGGTWNQNLTIFSHTGGTFTHNSGTVVINPGSPCTQWTQTVDVQNNTQFYNFTIQSTTGCAAQIVTTNAGDTLDILGDLTHTDGIFNGLAELKGNLVINAGSDGGSGTIIFNGTGAQTYAQNAGTARTGQIIIDKASGAVSAATGTTDFFMQSFTLVAGNFTAPAGNMNVGGTWNQNLTIFNHTGGIFNHNNGTVTINANSPCTQWTQTVDVLNSTQFYHFTVQSTTGCAAQIVTTAAGDTLDVLGNFTHTDGIYNGIAELKGNLIINSGSDGGTGIIIFNGTGAQTYYQAAGVARTGQIYVNKTSGAVTPAAGSNDLFCQRFFLQSGDFTAPSGTLNVGGVWTSNQTIFSHTGGLFSHNFGTVEINPNSPCTQYTFTVSVLTGTTFNNFIVNGTTGCAAPIITTGAGQEIQCDNNFTHKDGILNGIFKFRGNLTIAATSDGGTGIITANGTGFQQYTYAAGAARTCQIKVDKAAGVLSAATGTNSLSCQSFTLVSGRFIAPRGIMNIGGPWDVDTTLFNQIGGSFDADSGTVTINPNLPCTQRTFTINVNAGTWFYNLNINGTTGCATPIIRSATGDVVEIANDFTHTDGIIQGSYRFKGNLIIGALSDGGTATIAAIGGGTQTYTQAAGAPRTCQIIVNKPTGTFEAAVGTTNFSVQSLSLQSGTFKAPTGVLNIGGTWDVNTTLLNHTGGTFQHNNGTLTLNPNTPCTQRTFTLDVLPATTFYNLTFNGTTGCSNPIFINGAGDTLDVLNALTYTNGICNGAVEVGGNVTVASTHDGGNGRLIFKGTGNQNFTLTGATALFDGPVVVAKPSGNVVLGSDFTMDAAGTSLNLVSGNINTSSGTLLRVDRTITINGGSATSFVDGPMLRMVAFNGATSNLFFPIGKGGRYRQAYLNVTHNAATNFNYTAEVINSSAQALAYTLPGSIDKVSPVRYWQIDRSAAGNLTAASVQLFYGSDDGVTDNANLRIAQGTGGNWVNLGGTGSANGSGSITSSVNFTSFSPFTVSNATGGSNFPGSALDFVGGNDYVNVASGGGLNNLQEGTIEMWVKWSGTQDVGYSSSAWGAVLGRQSNGVFSNQVIGLNGSNPATAKIVWKPYAFTTNAIVSTATPGNNVWNHIAITYKSGEHKMYINGVLDNTGTTTGTINNNSSIPLTIGAWIGDGDCFSTSRMDEVRIWNRILCQAEIVNNMNCEIPTTASGLLANYHFNEGIGEGTNTGVTNLPDATGNGWNGTLTNMALSGTTSNWVSEGAVGNGISCGLYGPEINVKGNSTNIVDGDVTPSAGDHTDFGSIAVAAPFTRTYTIENLGISPLTVSSITVTGTHASMFVAGSLSPAGPIPVSGSATVTVTFTPTSTGVKDATLNIFSTDCDEATYDFALQGTGATAGAALNFDGTNDYIDLGNPSQLNFSKTTPFSIETWARFISGATQDQQLVSKTGTTNPNGWGLQCTEGAGRMGKIEFYLLGNYSNASQNMWIRSNYPTDIRDNTWHHIAATYDGSNSSSGLHIYIDGVDYGATQIQNNTIASGDITNSYNAKVGGLWTYSGGPAEYMYGELDETRIWSKALCANEITSRRNCEISTSYNNLVLNYHYNQGLASGTNTSITTATDASPAGINGTLTNFALTGASSNWISPGAVTSGVSCANQCDSTSAVPTAAGTYTSAMSYTSPSSGFTHYCDCQGNLLLSLKLGGSGAVVPENAVQLKINSTGAVFYTQHTGFVGNTFGYAAMDRTWDVDATTQPSSHVNVRYYFNNNDVTAVHNTLVGNSLPGIFGPNDMTFWKVINDTKPAHSQVPNLNQWDVKVLSYSLNPTDSTWVIGNRGGGNYFAQFKVWGFSGGGGGAGPLGLTPLPVELLYLTANGIKDQYIQVKWATATETNTATYTVERSEDGKTWIPMGNVSAAGNSQERRNYQFNDFQVVANRIYYYRLKVIEIDGSAQNTQIVSAKLGSTLPATLKLYPNPTSTTLNISWPAGTDEADMTLHTSDGKLVWTRHMFTGTDRSVDVSNLSNGVYMLSTRMNGEVVHSRVMIQR
ncbi:MAG: choice-of-anchor D domain-containing protein [Bacteroidetes bacterium]|nr:choice-of-anchor D domain-containing protein [Bacteroidota bacterium]